MVLRTNFKAFKVVSREQKFFQNLNALKFVRNTICAVHDKFQAGISQKRSWSFFKKCVTTDIAKKVKKLATFEKIFFAQNDLKTP